MALSFLTYKAVGTVYEVCETEFTKKKNYPKREIWIEVPSTGSSGNQKTEVLPFLVLGDECGSLDFWEPGVFVEIMFKIDSYMWTNPETGKKRPLISLKLLDLHKRDNPFKTGEKIASRPDDLSPSPVAELATNVRDYLNEPEKRDTLFNEDGYLNENPDDLPF